MTRGFTILSLLAALTAGFVLIQTGNAVTPVSKTAAGNKRHITLPTRTDTLPFSDGVLAGDTLYLAGRIGVDPATGKPPEDLEKEIRLLLDGMKTTLKEADMTMDDLVSVQAFVPTFPSTKSSTKSIAPTSPRTFPPAPLSVPVHSSAAAASKHKESPCAADVWRSAVATALCRRVL